MLASSAASYTANRIISLDFHVPTEVPLILIISALCWIRWPLLIGTNIVKLSLLGSKDSNLVDNRGRHFIG